MLWVKAKVFFPTTGIALSEGGVASFALSALVLVITAVQAVNENLLLAPLVDRCIYNPDEISLYPCGTVVAKLPGRDPAHAFPRIVHISSHHSTLSLL